MTSPRVFIQIGTNNGNDDFRKYVQEKNPDLIILVEPNKDLIQSIKANYSNFANVFLFSKAIYYESNVTVELVIPAKKGIYGSQADNGYTYTDVNYSLVPMNDWGDKNDMVKMQAETITFDDICKQFNIHTIEYLQIDTEGFDSEIIQMIDLTKYKINTIRFEKWYFKPECFTAYQNDKANKLGESGMKLALEKLEKYNYVIKDANEDYIATLRG